MFSAMAYDPKWIGIRPFRVLLTTPPAEACQAAGGTSDDAARMNRREAGIIPADTPVAAMPEVSSLCMAATAICGWRSCAACLSGFYLVKSLPEYTDDGALRDESIRVDRLHEAEDIV